MKKYKWLLLFSILPLFSLQSEITITIHYPVLETENSYIQNLIEEYFEPVENEIQAVIYFYADKADLLQAFAEANGFCIPGSFSPAGLRMNSFSVNLEATLGFQSFSLDMDEISRTLNETGYDDDLYLGVAIQPLVVSFGLPLKSLFPALISLFPSLTANIRSGYFGVAYSIYNFRAFNVGLSLTNSFFPVVSPMQSVLWTPFVLDLGITYLYNNLSLSVVFPPRTYGINIDPDGSEGYLPEITGALTLDLTPEVSLRSSVLAIPVFLSTILEWGWMFTLSAGCGFEVVIAQCDFLPYAETDFIISGDIGSFITDPGGLEISGSASANTAFPLRFMGGLALGITIDPLWIQIPLVYYFNNGLQAGIRIGLNI